MWFDTHAHLSDPKFDADRDQVIARAFSAGLLAIVEIADGPEEWPKAQALAEKYPNQIWWAAGLHPYYADQSNKTLWANLKSLTTRSPFVAIGEIGLDYAKCPIPPDEQKKAFQLGIELALDVNKPLIVHCRDAYADLMPILRRYFGKGVHAPGVVHCFSGNKEQAAELTQMGFYLGIDGPVTYPSSKNLHESIAAVPSRRLVLETDSPYLPPQTHRGQRNEPSCLPTIGAHLARLRNVPIKQLMETFTENSFTLFHLKRLE